MRCAAPSSSAQTVSCSWLGAEQLDEQRGGEAEVGVLVDEHVAQALRHPRAHVRALAQQRDGAQHELARVQRADLGEQPVVVEVQLRELRPRAPRARARRRRPSGSARAQAA